jgi:hypothetical protein
LGSRFYPQTVTDSGYDGLAFSLVTIGQNWRSATTFPGIITGNYRINPEANYDFYK